MRITRDLLLKNAEDTVVTRSEADENIIGAFLHGSLLDEDPMLGGTADIDLTFVYEQGHERREFVRLTDEIHLDICHQPKEIYQDGRGLRETAWEGSTIFNCQTMYDPKHFLDFTRANVRGLFDRPETVLKRAQPWLESARRMWMKVNSRNRSLDPSTADAAEYLNALEAVANAVASLSGPPLTERRFLLDFPQRTESLGQSGLAIGLEGLLGGNDLDVETVKKWLPSWEAAFDVPAETGVNADRIHVYRKPYYLRAINSILEGDTPSAALWPLLRTWISSFESVGGVNYMHTALTNAFYDLNILGDNFEQKLAGLDAYLDTVEALFEEWRDERGV